MSHNVSPGLTTYSFGCPSANGTGPVTFSSFGVYSVCATALDTLRLLLCAELATGADAL